MRKEKVKKNIARAAAAVMAAAVAAGALAGCGRKNGAKAAQTKDTITVAAAADAPNLSSYLQDTVPGGYMNRLTYNCLFRLDENLVPVPDLAESYEADGDNAWIIRLRKGVRFHNGEEMKAEDVKASLELCKASPEVYEYGESVASVEITDDYTVRITTDGPRPDLFHDLSRPGNAILPAKLIAEGHDFRTDPVGTGPYKLREWKKDESAEFEAFKDYFGGEPAIRHVIWKITPESARRAAAVRAGEADIAIGIDAADAAELNGTNGTAVYEGYRNNYSFMALNNGSEPFGNAAFRKAVASAVDRDAVIQAAAGGNGVPVTGMAPEQFPGATAEGAPGYDPEKAREYLSESGLDAEECGFTILCTDQEKLKAGEAVSRCLKDVLGIDAETESVTLQEYLERVASGDFQAAICTAGTATLAQYAEEYFNQDSAGAGNRDRLEDAEIAALAGALETASGQEESGRAAEAFCRALNGLCPHVPLYSGTSTVVYRSDITGFSCNADGEFRIENMSWAVPEPAAE